MRLPFLYRPLILLLLCLWGTTQGQGQSLPPDSAYAKGNFQEAITGFEAIVQATPSAIGYYNLGCAYFKNNELGRAILNFERAYRLSPTDPDIQFNLNYARSKATDKIQIQRSWGEKWFQVTNSLFSLYTWLLLGFLSFIISVAGIVLFIYTPLPWLRRVGFYGAAAFLVLCSICNWCAWKGYEFMTNKQPAVIVAPEVTLKSSPATSAEDLTTLHSGLKVITAETLNGFTQVTLPDNTVGWLPEETIEHIVAK